MKLLSLLSATLLIVSQLLTTVPSVSAQEVATEESVELLVGDIFEIIPSHTLVDATYTWILTQDRNFIEAGRAKIFRKRMITPGRYTLYGEITSGDNTVHISRTFVLDYKARVPGQVPVTSAMSGTTMNLLARTVPAPDTIGRVIMPAGRQMLKIEPVDQDVRPIGADLDIAHDSDGDGNPANDIETDQTFFQSDATPLYVWLAQPFTTHGISLTAARPEGAVTQRIDVLDAAYAQSQGLVQSPVSIAMQKITETTYAFSANFQTQMPVSSPLLYRWEFGDGQQSLINAPTHDYAESGTYEVKLQIRSLSDGKEIATARSTVTIEMAAQPSSQASSKKPTSNNTSSGSMFASLWKILLYGAILLASILAGVGVILGVSRLRGRNKSLADTLETIEQNVLKKDTSPAAPTLKIAAPEKPAATIVTTATTEPAKREEDRASTNPVLQKPLKVDEANAPAWLKGGLSNQAPTTPAPVPTPKVQKAPEQKSQPAPTPKPATNANTPAWLQQKPEQTPAAPKPAPISTPKPQAPQAPKSQPTPAPSPVAQPKPTPITQPQPQPPVTPMQPKPVPTPKAEAPVPMPSPKTEAPITAPAPKIEAPLPPPVVPENKSVSTPVAPAPAPIAPKPEPVVPQAAANIQSPPIQKPLQAPTPTAVIPNPTPTPKQPESMPILPEGADMPIAIIRADSLDKPKQEPGSESSPKAS